ncbi:MAG: MFS transporter [Alphaproteobacteria bacterium]|nr:MFS transporter [Alphaproteobacteria bacterium]
MRRIGRRAGFVIGAVIGACGAGLAAFGIFQGAFWVFVAGQGVIGFYNAVAHYFRFAAADVAKPEFKSQAISLVLSGGIVAGLIGPEVAKLTKDALAPVTFAGSYLAIIGFQCVVALLSSLVDIPGLSAEERRHSGRPMTAIMAQPIFIVAVTSSVVGYGAMNMLMTATPLAMAGCGLPFADAAFVIQWHMVAMFLPSFYTGTLIKRFGLLEVMFVGVVLLGGGIGAALSGVTAWHFWASLVLIGVGWNFMFIGGTTLLTDAYQPAERAKTQAANDFLVFGTMAVGSFLSGNLLHHFGWTEVNLGAVPLCFIAGGLILWLRDRRRRGV